MANRCGNSGRLYYFFGGVPKSLKMVLLPWNWKTLTPLRKSSNQPKQHIKNQRHYFAKKSPSSQDYCFSSSHVCMWELDYKESWALKNWCFWTVVEKTLRVPCSERRFNQSILKEISPECSLEGLMLKLQHFGHLIQRTDSLEQTWCWERLKVRGEGDYRITEDEMFGWHHWLNGHESG